MKVVYIDQVGTRGVAEKFAACLNRYHGHLHEARACVSYSFADRSKDPPPPPLWDVRDSAQVRACIEWADVVHLIHQSSYRALKCQEWIGRKPTVYQRFTLIDKGDWYPRLWEAGDFKHLRLALVAEGWQRYPLWSGLDYTILPAPFPIEDLAYRPIPVGQRKRQACFTPMSKKPGPPAPKAYDETVKALQGIKLDVVFRKPFAECMKRKARAWVGIDEVATPVIHFSAFEFLSLGVPCVSLFDELTERTVKEATGAASLPLLNADAASLRVAIDSALALDEDRMAEVSAELRGWMERHMHPRDVLGRYLELYRGA